MRKIVLTLALLGTAVSLSACYVAPPPGPGPRCHYVPAFVGPAGGVHPAHYACP